MTSRLRPLVLGLALLALCTSLPVFAETGRVVAHLFAVPETLADGSPATPRKAALEAWLTGAFGGFTRLGSGQGGWKNEVGQVETEANALYLVTGPSDRRQAIADRLNRDFDVRVPYVLVFPAEVFVPRRR